jgi:hypothetical protein
MPGEPLEPLREKFAALQGVDAVLLSGQLTGEGYSWRIGSANPRDCRS